MKNLSKYIIILFTAVLLTNCSSEDSLINDWIDANETKNTASSGEVDVTKYVAVGNSLTAGFYDGALFPSGQENSYPAILANQLKLIGGGEFVNPDIVNGNSGFPSRISIDLAAALAFIEQGQGSLADALVYASPDELKNNTKNDINNYGVPGARSIDIVTPGYGAANGLFGAFQKGATSSVVGDAASANGTFFTLWIGSNDVLGYASSGGTNDIFDPLNPSTITDADQFKASIKAALDALTANGAEGLILNVPPVTTAPYFQVATTLGGGVELVPLTDQALVDQLNGAFNVPFPSPVPGVDPGYNTLLDIAVALDPNNEALAAEVSRRKISWKLGANAPLITDESLSVLDISAAAGLPAGSIVLPQLRQASATNAIGVGDLFTLPALFTLGQALSETAIVGVTVPLGDEFTLTESEQINVIIATAEFNAIIAEEASNRNNVNLVDIHPLFSDINGLSVAQAAGLQLSNEGLAAADGVVGRNVNGINLVPISFETLSLYNSVYSTDFTHPNPRGAALVANEIIKVLNAAYNSTIPEVNPLDYEHINAPF